MGTSDEVPDSGLVPGQALAVAGTWGGEPVAGQYLFFLFSSFSPFQINTQTIPKQPKIINQSTLVQHTHFQAIPQRL